LGKSRAGQGNESGFESIANLSRNDFRDSHQTVVFNPFGCRDDYHFRLKKWFHLTKYDSINVRWNCCDDYFGSVDCVFDFVRGSDRSRYLNAGEIDSVFGNRIDRLDYFIVVCPERNLIAVLRRENGERRSPGASSDDCDSFHNHRRAYNAG